MVRQTAVAAVFAVLLPALLYAEPADSITGSINETQIGSASLDLNVADDNVTDSNTTTLDGPPYGPGICGCDLEWDGVINFGDLAVLASHWAYGDCQFDNYWCNDNDLNHNGVVYFDDLYFIAEQCWLVEDTTAPTPDPMQWDPSLDGSGYDGKPREIWLPPYDSFSYYSTMRADPNSYDETGLEFYFKCTTEGGFSSGWISFPDGPPYEYTVNVGRTMQEHRFKVKARDLSVNREQNVTGYSSEEVTRWW